MGIYYADELGNQAALIKMIHDDVNSAFSPDQSVSNFRSSARLLHGCRRKSRLYAAPPPSSGSPIVLFDIKGGIRNVSESAPQMDENQTNWKPYSIARPSDSLISKMNFILPARWRMDWRTPNVNGPCFCTVLGRA